MVVDPVRSDPIPRALENASKVSRVLEGTASALAHSARLAAAHAERQQRAGRPDLALQEQRAAEWAGEAADRAYLQAAKFGGVAAGATRADDRSALSPPA